MGNEIFFITVVCSRCPQHLLKVVFFFFLFFFFLHRKGEKFPKTHSALASYFFKLVRAVVSPVASPLQSGDRAPRRNLSLSVMLCFLRMRKEKIEIACALQSAGCFVLLVIAVINVHQFSNKPELVACEYTRLSSLTAAWADRR